MKIETLTERKTTCERRRKRGRNTINKNKDGEDAEKWREVT